MANPTVPAINLSYKEALEIKNLFPHLLDGIRVKAARSNPDMYAVQIQMCDGKWKPIGMREVLGQTIETTYSGVG